ncbi:hypothetical protein GWI33_004449 [Rhynchophorus ferrugineus]|uniref:Uncharacterized protein n=1 Tax=Rhynchophorus ferrugineus TaxID=354439 RepID=A0A834IN48_RHYFE|nr:hypothetical protein GWI33_004449 [Rhynchophorus ferrugineus]
MYQDAYKFACLGVTDGHWEELANSVLEQMKCDVARLAFDQQQKSNYPRDVILGDFYAMKGKLKESARFYQTSGHGSKALAMYTDLRVFDEAEEYFEMKDDDLVRKIDELN